MASEDWAPTGIDVSKPSVARMYDYYLNGKDNFEVDRVAAEEAIAAAPVAAEMAVENRSFLGRAVRYLVAEAGIRQFIDLGTGLPTMGNVHEVAHEVTPDARVVYVDYDPIVLAHARALLAEAGRTTIVQADMREPEAILGSPRLRELIDFDQPVAVLMVAVLHFVTDEENPRAIIDRFRQAMAPGSYLVLSHATGDTGPDAAKLAEAYRNASATAPVVPRSHAQIQSLFDGFEVVEPGVVHLPQWRPDSPESVQDPERMWILSGVGRKD